MRLVRAQVKLSRVFRQRDARLLDLLEAVRYGQLQERHAELLLSLDRPVPEGPLEATKLYAVNALVDRENHARLHGPDCSGEVHSFQAIDLGKAPDLAYLTKSILAADTLELRVGAQVC